MKGRYSLLLLAVGALSVWLAYAADSLWFKFVALMCFSICFTIIAANIFIINEDEE